MWPIGILIMAILGSRTTRPERRYFLGPVILLGLGVAIGAGILLFPAFLEWADVPIASWNFWHLAGAIILLYIVFIMMAAIPAFFAALFKKPSQP